MDHLSLPALITFQLLPFALSSRVVISEIDPLEKDLSLYHFSQDSFPKKPHRSYYDDDLVKSVMVLKLNSLAKIYPHISVTDRRHVQALAKLVNSGIPAVEVSQSDEEFMRQIIQQVEGIAFFHPETNRNFLEGNCISTTILHKSVQEALKILRVSETGCALSFEAMNGRKNAFTQIVHREKKHKGQEIFANSLNTFITHNSETSGLGQSRDKEHSRIQDPYCIRCSPQVQGVAYDVAHECLRFLETELEELQLAEIMIDGQFYPSTHSNERCVQLFDYLALSVHEISSISLIRSERILNKLINKLPTEINDRIQTHKYLFGLLATISSSFLENKGLCYPVVADTTIRNNYKHDVQNSLSLMYRKYTSMWRNIRVILAFEVMVATTALTEIKAVYKEDMTPVLEEVYHHALHKFEGVSKLSTSDIFDLLQPYSLSVEAMNPSDLLDLFKITEQTLY